MNIFRGSSQLVSAQIRITIHADFQVFTSDKVELIDPSKPPWKHVIPSNLELFTALGCPTFWLAVKIIFGVFNAAFRAFDSDLLLYLYQED